jgi:pSer/pThr/pTyr-binding forkhead associated (FHA) protein
VSGAASEAARPRLVWERADGSRQTFPLVTSPMTVGRDETADICVDEALVSRAHARIERRGDRYVVVDLGSTNLTRVNGDVVLECELHHGDEVRFARAKCRFLLDGGADPLAGGV